MRPAEIETGQSKSEACQIILSYLDKKLKKKTSVTIETSTLYAELKSAGVKRVDVAIKHLLENMQDKGLIDSDSLRAKDPEKGQVFLRRFYRIDKGGRDSQVLRRAKHTVELMSRLEKSTFLKWLKDGM